jgi:ATP-dependent helicase HepA
MIAGPMEVPVFPPGALVRDVEAPEAGVGRVLRYDDETRAADVLFESDEQPRVVRQGDTVRRLWIHPGQSVTTLKGEEGVVEGFCEQETGEPWYYNVRVGDQIEELSETEIEPVGPRSGDPLDLLQALRWRGGWRFFARWNLYDKAAGWSGEAEGLPAWLATRRPLSPVSIAAAQRVLYASDPRAVLALPTARERRDACGLVWLALAHEDPNARALIVVPGGATRSWASRLFLDHGGRQTTHVDLVRWQQTPDFLREEVLSSSPCIVVSAVALARDPDLRDSLDMLRWDLVAVEGAQLLGDDLREWLAGGAGAAAACLALLPPPQDLDPAQAANWLRLTGLEVEVTDLEQRAKTLTPLWEALAASEDDASLLAAAKKHLPKDAYAKELVSAEDADALRVYLSEECGLDPRLIVAHESGLEESSAATDQVFDHELGETAWLDHLATMPVVSEDPLSLAYREALCVASAGGPGAVQALLSERALSLAATYPVEGLAELFALQPSPGEAALLTDELLVGAPAAPGEDAWIEAATPHLEHWGREGWAALGALTTRIEDHLVDGGDAAIVLVQGGGSAVEAVGKGLGRRLGEEAVAVLHDALEETERAEVLQRFRSQAACCVLVSDEIVSGGRRVGSAELVVRLGQPMDLLRLSWAELGEIESQVVLRGSDELSDALAAQRAQAERVSAWPAQRQEISAALGDPAALAAALTPREPSPAARAHDLAPARLEAATELGEALEEAGVEGDAQELRAWARSARLRLDSSGQREWNVSWRVDGLPRELPGLPDEGTGERRRLRGTFDPICAREREGLGVFAPGHPFIDALVRDARDPKGDGRLTVIRRELGPGWPGRLALVVVARCRPDTDTVPPGLGRRAQRALWEEPYAEVVALFPGQAEPAKAVTDRAARNVALAPFVGKEVEPKVDPDALCEAIPLLTLQACVQAGVDLALERVRSERAPLAEDAAGQLREALAPARAGAASRGEPTDLYDHVVEAVAKERIELEALALLVG